MWVVLPDELVENLTARKMIKGTVFVAYLII